MKLQFFVVNVDGFQSDDKNSIHFLYSIQFILIKAPTQGA